MAKTVLDKFTNQFLLHDHVSLRGDTMTGALTITPSADSVSIFIVNKADATPVLTVDTSGGNVITSGYTYLGGTSSTGLRIKGTDTSNTIWQPNSGSTLAISANGGSITLGQTSDPDFTLGSTGLITTTNSIGIGAVPPGNQRLNIAGTQTGSDNAFGVYMGALTLSPANTYGAYFQYVGGGFVATGTSNTIALAVGLYAEAIQKTGTGTITDTYGLYVNPSTTGSNNYGAYIGGNVGIGTTSPGSSLDVVVTSTDSERGLTLRQIDSSARAAQMFFRKARGTPSSLTTVANSDYVSAVNFAPYDGDSYLQTAGFGGRVNGTVADNSIPTDIFFYTSGGATDTDPYTNNHIRMLISSSGNVGIGTVTPITKLHVYHATLPILALVAGGDNPTVGGAVDLLETDPNNTGFATSGSYGFRVTYDGSDNHFKIRSGNETTNTVRLAIERDTGNVGLGTAAPAQLLDISKGFLRFTYESSPSAPTVAVNVTAGNLNGAYSYLVTFVTAQGETNSGTASSTVNPATQQVDLSAIPTGTSGKVTSRKIYRTAAGGTTYKLLTTISDNTTTTYTDNIVDGSLGATAPGINTTAGKIYTGTTQAIHISHNGFIGMGTDASSTQRLTINESKTTTSAFTPMLRCEVFASPSSASSATVIGAWYRSFYTSASNCTGSITGQYNEAVLTGAGTLSLATGGVFQTKVDSAGIITNAISGEFGFTTGSSKTGSVVNLYNLYSRAPSLTGSSVTITDLYGLRIDSMTAGSSVNYSIFAAGGQSRLSTGGATVIGLVIKGAAAQSANLQEWWSSADAVLASVDDDGTIDTAAKYEVDGVQVVSNRVIDARIDDVINSGDATTDGVIDAIVDCLIAHGLVAAA